MWRGWIGRTDLPRHYIIGVIMEYIYGLLPESATIETKTGWKLIGKIKREKINSANGWTAGYHITPHEQRLTKNYYLVYKVITTLGDIDVLKQTYFHMANGPIHFEDIRPGREIITNMGAAEVIYISFAYRDNIAYYISMEEDTPLYVRTKNSSVPFLLSLPVKRDDL